MKIPEEDLAELDVQIDPFMTYQRPQPGANHHLRIEHITRDGHRSRSKLVGHNDENMSSIGSKMSFGGRKRVTSHLNSDLSLTSSHLIQTTRLPEELSVRATPTKEEEDKETKSRKTSSALNLPFPIAM